MLHLLQEYSTHDGYAVMAPILIFLIIGFAILIAVAVIGRVYNNGREAGQRDMLEVPVYEESVV